MTVASDGDLVLLIGQDRKRFIQRLQVGGLFQTHRGIVSHDELIGRTLGRQFDSHLGYPFVVLEPSTSDLIQHLKRSTQIMYPKDIGYTLLKLSVIPTSRVIEAGTGSGGLTVALTRLLQPPGRLFSYEARADILRVAEQNLQGLGLSHLVEFKQRDIIDGFDETDVDALFLDVRQPWLYLQQVTAALKSSGFFGSILPTTNQVSRLVYALEREESFGQIEVEELLLRPYKPVPARLRPADRMVAHTGYLIFARKVGRDVVAGDFWADKKRRKFEKTENADLSESDQSDASWDEQVDLE